MMDGARNLCIISVQSLSLFKAQDFSTTTTKWQNYQKVSLLLNF